MGAVLEYINQNGKKSERSWKVNDDIRFTALIKCWVQIKGKRELIEKPSKRPATYSECRRFANKLKAEYGRDLKQIVVWNMDEMKSIQKKTEGLYW